jgi:hypothetical protein
MAVKKRQRKVSPIVKTDHPVKVEGPQLKGSGNDVAMEEITLDHEGVQLEKDP